MNTMVKYGGQVVEWDPDVSMRDLDQCEWTSRLGRCGKVGSVMVPPELWLCIGDARWWVAGLEGEIDLAEHRLTNEDQYGLATLSSRDERQKEE